MCVCYKYAMKQPSTFVCVNKYAVDPCGGHSLQYRIAGKVSCGANFCVFRAHNENAISKNRELLNSPKFWHVQRPVRACGDGALSLFLDSKGRLLETLWTLSRSLTPAALYKAANDAAKGALAPTKARGAYTKFTPEQQAMIGKYASFHGNRAGLNSKRRSIRHRHYSTRSVRGVVR